MTPLQAMQPVLGLATSFCSKLHRKRLRLVTLPAFLFVVLQVSLQPAYPQQGPGGVRSPISPQTATEEETKALQFLREEEKLARDIYRALHKRWPISIFDRIATSEQQHFASIGSLLSRYNLPDPSVSDIPGKFVNERLSALYEELVSKGNASLQDALEVGVLIEKEDINDLAAALQTNKLDIKRVYTNLLTASFNHLDAFEANLEILEALR